MILVDLPLNDLSTFLALLSMQSVPEEHDN